MRTIYKMLACAAAVMMIMSGCSSVESRPDPKVSEMINEYVSEHSQLSLDNTEFEWDTVIVDSAYGVKSACEKLDVSNAADLGSIPYDDEIVLAFLKQNKIVSYAVLPIKSGSASDYLVGYMYQNTSETYPYGTVFKK